MKAIGYKHNLPIEDEDALQDIEVKVPKAQGRDILVEVKAVSVNPADYKVRQNITPEHGEWKVLGWDAAGIGKESPPKGRGLQRSPHRGERPCPQRGQA